MGGVHLPTRAFAWDGFPCILLWYINRSLFGFLPSWLGHLAGELWVHEVLAPKTLSQKQPERMLRVCCSECMLGNPGYTQWAHSPHCPPWWLTDPPSLEAPCSTPKPRAVWRASALEATGKMLPTYLPVLPSMTAFSSLSIGSLAIPRSQCQATYHPLWGLLPACLSARTAKGFYESLHGGPERQIPLVLWHVITRNKKW